MNFYDKIISNAFLYKNYWMIKQHRPVRCKEIEFTPARHSTKQIGHAERQSEESWSHLFLLPDLDLSSFYELVGLVSLFNGI